MDISIVWFSLKSFAQNGYTGWDSLIVIIIVCDMRSLLWVGFIIAGEHFRLQSRVRALPVRSTLQMSSFYASTSSSSYPGTVCFCYKRFEAFLCFVKRIALFVNTCLSVCLNFSGRWRLAGQVNDVFEPWWECCLYVCALLCFLVPFLTSSPP